jgi:hypothetical protein
MHEQTLLPDLDPHTGTGGLKRFGLGVAVVALIAGGVGIAMRLHATSGLHAVASEASIPNVSVVIPARRRARMSWFCPPIFRRTIRRRSMRAPAAM